MARYWSKTKDENGNYTKSITVPIGERKDNSGRHASTLFTAIGGLASGGIMLFFGWFMIVFLNRANSGLPYFGFRQFLSLFNSDGIFSWFSNWMNDASNLLESWMNAMTLNSPSNFLNVVVDFFSFIPKLLLGFFNICFQLSGFMANIFSLAFNFVGGLLYNTNEMNGDPLNDIRDANWDMWINASFPSA